jgi:hypothetical protein
MAPDARPPNTRRQIENDLLEPLHERQQEWRAGGEGNREIARQRFVDAVEAFSGFVLYGKLPAE